MFGGKLAVISKFLKRSEYCGVDWAACGALAVLFAARGFGELHAGHLGGYPGCATVQTGTAPVSLPPQHLSRLDDWCRGQRLAHSVKRPSGILKLVLPEDFSRECLAAPLSGEHGITGLALLVAPDQGSFEEVHHEMLDALREPLAVALENDLRVHELATLREAAEADRGSLLRRLGKRDMVDEIVGESSGLRPVMERVNLVAASDVPGAHTRRNRHWQRSSGPRHSHAQSQSPRTIHSRQLRSDPSRTDRLAVVRS